MIKIISFAIFIFSFYHCEAYKTRSDSLRQNEIQVNKSNDTFYVEDPTGHDTSSHTLKYTNNIQPPKFKGNIQDFIKNHLKYPKDARALLKEGKVSIICTIKRNGEVIEPRIIQSVFPSIDSEAMRIVRTMPPFRPAKMDGRAIDYNSYVIDIDFNP